MEIFVVRLGELLAPGAGFFERRRIGGNAIAGRKRGPAAGDQFARVPLHYFRGCRLAVVILASRHDRGLDFAAALHQLLEDAVQFVEVSVAGDECAGLESTARDQVKSLAADGRRVVERGAQRDVAVVNAIGIER